MGVEFADSAAAVVQRSRGSSSGGEPGLEAVSGSGGGLKTDGPLHSFRIQFSCSCDFSFCPSSRSDRRRMIATTNASSITGSQRF